MNDLSKACLDEARNSMQSALRFLELELAKIRAGKANPGMLDGVKVDYYGTMTEISQVANINTPDARSIIIPPLTEERRRELSKAAKVEVENSKVNIRNVRRNVMDKVKKLKDKAVPEDEVKQVEKELQDITDKNIAECDKIYTAKEKEIMSI